LKPQRLEWRTVGADWIAHPKLAEAVFGTVKAIVEEICAKIVKNGYSIDYLIPAKYRKDFFAGYTNKNHMARVHFRKDLNKYNAGIQAIYWPTKDVNWQAFPIIDDFGLSKSSKDIEDQLYQGKATITSVKSLAKVLRKMSTYSRYKAEIERFVEVCCKNKDVLEKILRRDMRETWLDGKSMFRK
jgi:hypothetical protein